MSTMPAPVPASMPESELMAGFFVASAPEAPSATHWLDHTAVGNWLEPFRRQSPHTFRAYQRNAAYWLYFLECTHGYHTDLLRRAGPLDAHNFIQALSHEADVGLGAPSASTDLALSPGPDNAPPFWRNHQPQAWPNHFGVMSNPFAKVKSPRSIAQSIAALSSLYKFNNTKRSAHDEALLDFNPFADLSRFVTKQDAKTDRVFEPQVYQHLLNATDRLGREASTSAQQQRAIRLRWITVALFNLWIRVSELASIKMSDFRQRGGVWFVLIHGKGRKVRAVEMTPAVMQELMAYRAAIGLPELPQRTETDIAGVASIRRTDSKPYASITPRALFGEVKTLGAAAADEVQLSGHTLGDDSLDAKSLADRLRQISPHWFRHSGASEAINGSFPIADAAERLGHKDPAITVRMYYHGDAKRRVGALQALEEARQTHSKKGI